MSVRIRRPPREHADVTMPSVPEQPAGRPAAMLVPKFFVKQRITLMVNRYEIRVANPDGTEGALMAFAEQKRMKLKEEINFFSVFDEDGQPLGYFKKQFGASLLRSTWTLSAPGIDAVGRERSQLVAILRRIWGWIPYVGDIWVPFVFHFDFVDTTTGQPVMTSQRIWSVRDRYEITVPDERLDFRVAAAMAVALDALQSR
jgi:uncharacterized protein YxjI